MRTAVVGAIPNYGVGMTLVDVVRRPAQVQPKGAAA